MARTCILLAVSLMAVQAFAGPKTTGSLKGHIDIGPITPVERVGQKRIVSPGMYAQYKVTITGPAKGQAMSRLAKLYPLDSKGNFSVDLAPGSYIVGVTAAGGRVSRFPGMPSKQVRILAGKTSTVNLSVDTGIR